MAGLTTLRIAWRNLGRNQRRTWLALAAIGLAQMLVLVYNGVMRGEERFFVDIVTGPLLGHVQAHAPRWRQERSMDLFLDRAAERIGKLRAEPGVVSASGRIVAPALAALGEEGQTVFVFGVDPGAESGKHGLLAEEKDPARQLGGKRVLIGRLLAKTMGVAPGAQIALVGQAADGSLANDLFTVSGFADTPVDTVNRNGLVLSLDDAQQLFAMPDSVHEIVVRGQRPEDAPALADRLAKTPELQGAEVLDWERLAPEMKNVISLFSSAELIILVLVLLAAATGVANTMMMATFERYHELGMLLALGSKPTRLVRMVVVESLVLGLLGAVLGTVLGIAVVLATSRTGIDLSAFGGAQDASLSTWGIRMTMRFFPEVNPSYVVKTLAAVAITSLLASLWPAARAARLQPIEAMRS